MSYSHLTCHVDVIYDTNPRHRDGVHRRRDTWSTAVACGRGALESLLARVTRSGSAPRSSGLAIDRYRFDQPGASTKSWVNSAKDAQSIRKPNAAMRRDIVGHCRRGVYVLEFAPHSHLPCHVDVFYDTNL